MKKFNVYSNETVFYMQTIEAENEKEAYEKADHAGNFLLGEDDVQGGMDSGWHVEFVEKVKE